MVVLSVSICTKGGKALVSRQYVEMTRMRVEGLLAAFPKLISGHAKQHTFVETDTVRYVYQPLENNMYLLLVTTKASNIVEDLSTLRLLAKVVPDVSGSLHEMAINEYAFELIFAFDEVLTPGGYREEATLASIRTNLQMDSHEEKMHNMLKQSKQEAAKAEMLRKQKEISTRQKQQLIQSFAAQNGMAPNQSGMAGFGGGGQPNDFSGFGSDSQQMSYEHTYDTSYRQPEPEPVAPRVPVKGMKLGASTGKKDNFMAAMAAEDNFSLAAPTSAAFSAAPVAPKPAMPSAPLTLQLEEKINCSMNRDGGVDSAEVKGTLTLTANTEHGSNVKLSVNKSTLSSQCTDNWTFATHPKIHKPTYEKTGVIGLKDASKSFPLSRPIAVLRWTYSSDDAAPLTINCWPEDQGDGTVMVNIEYELVRSSMTLHDVNIVLPLGTADPPAIEAIDGLYKHDPKTGTMCWHHDVIDANNSSGSLEFAVPGSDTDTFFPIRIAFASQTMFCPIEVTEVFSTADKSPVPNNLTKNVIPESYQVL